MDAERTRLLLVVGLGRSGTSTVAGALSRLGLRVPQPEVPADESNPRGFYEPQWVVDFHKRLLAEGLVRTNDARPDAAAQVRDAWDQPPVRDRLQAWLAAEAEHVGRGGQIVVKDPRTVWFLELWRDAAEQLGLEPCFLTMLRHPVEVARSRDTHYLADRDEDFRRQRLTGSVASWVNGTVETERATRGRSRVFVPYDDLLADWRRVLGDASGRLRLDLSPPLEHSPHPVDEFIEPSLNRSRVAWDDLSVPDELRALADRAWEACGTLVGDPGDEGAAAVLDDVGCGYARLHDWAEAITTDLTSTRVQAARRQVRRQLREGAQPGEPGGQGPGDAPAPGQGGGRAVGAARRVARRLGVRRHRR